MSLLTSPDKPHLVTLVLQSKKALQHGQLLCSRASTFSSSSAQTAVDVMTLDAKVRWLTDAVLAQLKLATSVAKNIEQKRAQLELKAGEWDNVRTQRIDALDAVLESLGAQVVPPDFHATSADDISLFGSQHGSDDGDDDPVEIKPSHSPTETVRVQSVRDMIRRDRSKWKTLRDFVDDRAIEEELDKIDNKRNLLDDILSRTADYPETLSNTIAAIRDSLPVEIPFPSVEELFNAQEAASAEMANHLESLAAHYDQMASALQDIEAGEAFSEEDMHEMNRDTDELPAIIAELEQSMSSIETSHERLLESKQIAQQHLDTHHTTLADLDELGDIMTEMLERQEAVETEILESLERLKYDLIPIEALTHHYTSYQYSYNHLVVELARRRQYREAAEKIVQAMVAQLEAMHEEERRLREEFQMEHGSYLPEDVCSCVQNTPTRWDIVSAHGEPDEILPDIDHDLLEEAQHKIVGVRHTVGASQSL